MSNQPRPTGRTYWVNEYLLAGEHPTTGLDEHASSEKLKKYLDCGIETFVDLTHDGERLAYDKELLPDGIQYTRLPIVDFGIPNKELMHDILNTIDSAIQSKKKVYVHCRGGIGRTGTTVGCFLVQNEGISGEQALSKLNKLFSTSEQSKISPRSPETPDQINFVRSWGN